MSTAREYRDFAAREVRGRSPLYEELSLGVAGDPELLALLDELPPAKRQPNLLYAAARYVRGSVPAGYDDFRRTVFDERAAVVATMLARRTQTNEPGRCAALYPVLASLPQPLALLEVGASAGLCLLPDRYSYGYGNGSVGAVHSAVHLETLVEGEPAAGEPGAIEVVWRAGIDLNPLDVGNPDDVRWLRTLVWPEQHDRLARLDAAIELARADPPRIVAGDLNERLGELAAQAPAGATLVVFHTAVLHYVSGAGRAAFTAQVDALDCHWLSQEEADVFPDIAERLPERPPPDRAGYVVALDHRPLAFSAQHGGWLRRLPGDRA